MRTPRSDQQGAALVEYSLLVALIALACLVGMAYFGSSLGDNMSRSGTSVVRAGS